MTYISELHPAFVCFPLPCLKLPTLACQETRPTPLPHFPEYNTLHSSAIHPTGGCLLSVRQFHGALRTLKERKTDVNTCCYRTMIPSWRRNRQFRGFNTVVQPSREPLDIHTREFQIISTERWQGTGFQQLGLTFATTTLPNKATEPIANHRCVLYVYMPPKYLYPHISPRADPAIAMCVCSPGA